MIETIPSTIGNENCLSKIQHEITPFPSRTTWKNPNFQYRPNTQLYNSTKHSGNHIRHKELVKFTRELDLYLQASNNLPRQIFMTSPSVASISANTVVELKPYHSEFQSAGLAVTSDEQKCNFRAR
ncbi:hypothetical protein K3495_g4800 [Podosphaera aphanis]|nr:hypothetical protein K3495_g4800 [Podosphaera aphanis]